jgi:CDP-glucose 4,6-dehydratase|tara:strand:- start:764 stop:1831 length:1068 start_codon:yes stop_codon:yes gene_type:complete
MKNTIEKNFWKNKKVFITGHTGFKGSWLSLFLNYLGADVTGYSLEPNTKPSLFDLAKIKNVIKKSIIADVRDYKKLKSELDKSKATIVFHLAAQPLVRLSYIHPKDTFDVNFTGSLNILHAIKKNKRVKTGIIITTDKVYDISKNKIFREEDTLKGSDPYSASKVCVEFLYNSYQKSFFSKSDKMIATVRAGNVIGGGDYSLDRLIPDIYKSSLKNKKIFIRNPNAIRPWQHVLEPLSGYLLLAQNIHNKKINKMEQHWNFGPNISSCKSVKYLTQYLSKKLKLKIIQKKPKSNLFKPETSVLRLSNYKSRKFLSWHPKWSIKKSLDKILQWNVDVKSKNASDVCIDQIKEYLGN